MRRSFRLLNVMLCTAALVSGLSEAVAFVVAPHVAPAAAASAATGTGGQFVAVQGRVLDTRPATQVGPYNTAMSAGVWRSIQIGGTTMSDGTQLPNSISAVSVNISVISPSAAGYICADKDSSSPRSTAVVRYTSTDDQANTATLPVAANGKIAVKAATSTNLVVEVQGYYTADDSVAPGGYVPVTPKRIIDTYNGIGRAKGKLASGSTTTIQVASAASGVPEGATAAILNITTFNDTSTADHYYVPYPADDPKPAGWSSSFPVGDTDASEVHVGLSTTGSPLGAIKFYLSQASSYTVDIQVDVLGYFTPGTSKGAFTPATTRVYATGTYDTNSPKRAAIAPQATTKVQVGGVNGVPLAGSGISAVSIHLNVYAHGTHGGYAEMWASGTSRPSPYSSVNLARNGNFIGNLVTTQLGTDGAVNIFNQSQDAIDVLVDVEGWYSGVGSAIANGQTRTQQSIELKADSTVGGPWVTYRYRNGIDGNFTDVPVADVKDTGGEHPPAWPVQRDAGAYKPYSWNARATLGPTAVAGVVPDTILQVEACYGSTSADTATACGMPTTVNFSQTDGGDATVNVGPGTLSELTGDYQVAATDASVNSSLGQLGFARTLSTLQPAVASASPDGVFGPGWTADLAGPADGNVNLSVEDHSDKHYLMFKDGDGSVETYVDPTASNNYPMTFLATGDDAGNNVVAAKSIKSGYQQITMTEQDNTTSTWTKNDGQSTWRPASISGPGSNSTSTYTYSVSGITAGLVTRVLGPVPAGVSCAQDADHTAGCRSLVFDYTDTVPVRLKSVSLSSPKADSSSLLVPLAQYAYDGSGRLSQAWNPQIQPELRTTYTYTAQNRLESVTPPGLAAWHFTYDTSGRLITVTRPDSGGQTSTRTIVYDVPVLGEADSPVSVGSAKPADWGQDDDLPVTATAVFGPNRVPSAPRPAAEDWPFASIDFLDTNGRPTNAANYGNGDWQVSAKAYSSSGSELWSLTPGNLRQAIQPVNGTTDRYAAAQSTVAARASVLRSETKYSALSVGSVTETFGPVHPVDLADGSTEDAREHVVTTYDAGAPDDQSASRQQGGYGLPTSIATSAYALSTDTPADYDKQTVTYTYDALAGMTKSGWELGLPTRTAINMGPGEGPDLVTATSYDDNGRITSQQLPSESVSTGVRTTLTQYFSATGSGSCVDPARAGLVCSTRPDQQPRTGQPVANTSYDYDSFGRETTKTEVIGDGTAKIQRVSTIAYDAGGRPSRSSITVSPTASGGIAIPEKQMQYDTST